MSSTLVSCWELAIQYVLQSQNQYTEQGILYNLQKPHVVWLHKDQAPILKELLESKDMRCMSGYANCKEVHSC